MSGVWPQLVCTEDHCVGRTQNKIILKKLVLFMTYMFTWRPVRPSNHRMSESKISFTKSNLEYLRAHWLQLSPRHPDNTGNQRKWQLSEWLLDAKHYSSRYNRQNIPNQAHHWHFELAALLSYHFKNKIQDKLQIIVKNSWCHGWFYNFTIHCIVKYSSILTRNRNISHNLL